MSALELGAVGSVRRRTTATCVDVVPQDKNKKKKEPYNPRPLEYELRKPTRYDRQKKRVLGIEPSLLRPLDIRPARWNSNRHSSRRIEDLSGFEPTRMRFAQQHPTEYERDDGWFDKMFLDLFLNLYKFALSHFDYRQPLPGKNGNWRDSPWLLGGGFSQQFLYYAGLVAKPDTLNGGWDGLLRNQHARTFLVVGVIAKTLELGVFSELLFGADETQRALFERQDEATLELEGK
jgi:hypothetical protein